MAMAIRRLQRKQREGRRGTRSVRRQLLRLTSTTTRPSSSVSDCLPRPSSLCRNGSRIAARSGSLGGPAQNILGRRPTLKGTAAETDQKRPSHFLPSPTPPRPISCMLSGLRWDGRGREAALLSDVVLALLSLGPWPAEQGHAAKTRFFFIRFRESQC